MSSSFEFDLDRVKVNQLAKYLGKGCIVQKLSFVQTDTQTHIRPVAVPGPLHWSSKRPFVEREDTVINVSKNKA